MKKKWFGRKAKSYSSRITLEQLEERIVLDASVPATSVDNPDNPDNTQVEQQAQQANTPEAQNAPTQAAADAATSSDPIGDIYNQDLSQVLVTSDLSIVDSINVAAAEDSPLRALVVSSSIDGADELLQAADENVITVMFDGSNSDPSSLLDTISTALNGRKVDSIGFALHNMGEGQFHLAGEYAVSPTTLLGQSTLQDFWRGVGDFLNQDGRIDMLTCNLAATQAGSLVISQIEQLAEHEVAASTDLTGSPEKGGDWILETENIDLLATYFAKDKLADFDSVLVAEQKITASDGGSWQDFGWSVSIDGSHAIVGAVGDDDNGAGSGSAYIYYFNGTTWSQQAKMTADDGASGDSFGNSVSIDGNYAIVGASGDDDNGADSGSAYIYHFNGTTWSQQAKITADDGAELDLFGSSVSISGNYAVVGAYGDDDNGSYSGSAYLYHFNGTTWSQQTKITADDGASGDYFGHSVSIDGNYAIVGAKYGNNVTGSAYIYHFNGTTWSQQTKITADDGAELDLFGSSVSISGNYAVVGAYGDDDNGSYSGSAYLYHFNGTTWSQQTKITADDGASGDYFGHSVSIDGNYAIVGAKYGNNVTGSAYIYHFNGTTWSQQGRITADDGASGDYFGSSVSVDGNYAVVGAYRDDDNWNNSGSAYIFDLTMPTNDAPSAISIDNDVINENMPSGTLVGTFSTVDQDTGDIHTYALVNNDTHPDNAAFTIEGDVLKAAADFNFEGQNSYKIGIQTNDGNGGNFVTEFTININDVNETPTGVSLAPNNLNENSGANHEFGILTASDPDSNQTFTYTLIDGAGNTDNASFTINGNKITAVDDFDHETKDSYSIRVRATDQGGLFTEQAFTINVNDVNDVPTDITLSANTVNENIIAGTAVGSFSSSDQDGGDLHTYALVQTLGHPGTDNGLFQLSTDGHLTTNATFNYEAKSLYTISVQTDDGHGGTFVKEFIITVDDVNEAPVVQALAVTTSEDTPTHVSLVGTDVDGDGLTMSVVANPAHGSLTDNQDGTYTYTPNANYNGLDSFTYSASDGRLQSAETAVSITVNSVNDGPTNITLSSHSINENSGIGAVIGTLSTADPDNDLTFTYTLVDETNYPDNAAFTIEGDVLKTAADFNFEGQNSYKIGIQTNDGNGGNFVTEFTININDVNETPTGVSLAPNNLNENSGANHEFGILTASDPDSNQTFTYTLIDGAGNTDNASFTINGNKITAVDDFDHETKDSYSIRVRATDQGGLFTEQAFTINVNDVNDVPTDITISSNGVDENLPAGTVVGNLSTIDEDGGPIYTYSIAGGSTYPDNSKFTIIGNQLLTAGKFNFENKDLYRVNIQADDGNGGSVEKILDIHVLDANDRPTNIQISTDTINENSGAGALVATLSTVDQDVNQSHSYSLLSTADKNYFSISGNELRTTADFDFETDNSYTIKIKTTDQEGATYSKEFEIKVADVNDIPTGINLNTATIPENSGTGAVIGVFSSDDQDTGQYHNYSLVSGFGDNDNASFEIDGTQLKAKENFNYEIQADYSVRVQTDDGHGGLFEKVFIINVEDVNDTPYDISLTSNTVSENVPAGTVVGTLVASDEDGGPNYDFRLTDSSNYTDNQFFEIVGDQLVTTAQFNFELKDSYSIKVQVNDGNSDGTFDKVFEISVLDANDAPTNITLTSYIIDENSGAGATVGILDTADEDVAQTHSYSFVNSSAYPDNQKFVIVGNELRTAADFDHEIKDSYLIRVKSTDGSGGSVTRNLTISVSDINEAPTVNVPTSAAYLEDATTVAIPGIVVNDQDDGAVLTATLTLGDHENAGAINSAHVASNSDGVWQFSGSADDVNAELASLVFNPNHNYDVNTSINVLVLDGQLSDSGDIALNVTPSSDKSTLAISDTSFVFVVSDNTPINVGANSNIIVDDPDTGDTLTVKLTWNKQTGSVVYDGGTDSDGLLEFTGDKNAVNDMLESVSFVPTDGLRKDTSLTVAVKDTDGISFDATKTISLKKNFQTSVQTWDTSISQWVGFNEDTPYVREYIEGYDKVFLPSIKIVDGDSNETVTVTLKLDDVSTGYLTSKTNYTKDTIYNESTGVWTYTGKVSNVNTMLGKVVFVPGEDTDVNSSVSVRISDGDSDPIEGTIILDVTPRNDIPVFVSLPETEDGVIRYDENSPSVSLAGISIADPDTAENDITVMVKVYEPDTGALELAAPAEPGAIVGDYHVVDGVGVWSVTGTVEQVNNTLDRLLFIPQTDNDSDSSLSIEVTDHEYEYTVKEYLNLEVIPAEGVNDPIEAGFLISGQIKPITFEPTVQYKEGYDNVYLPTIVVSDDDADDVFTALFTLQNTDTLVTITPDYVKDAIGYVESYYNATPLTYKGAGVWALENVNMTDLNYALNHLRFQPTDYNDHNANLNIVIKDDDGTSVTANVSLKVIAKNSQASFIDTPESVINYDEDSAPFVLKTTDNGADHFLRVDDPDTGEKLTATVKLSDTGVGSINSTYSYGGTTKTISGSTSGVWTIKNKSVEEVNLALENLKFTPKANNEKDAWFSVEVKDGGENATVNLYREFDLKVNPKNDQVKVSGDAGVAVANAVKYQGDMNLKTALDLPDIEVVDIDTKEKVKATFTLNVDPSLASLSRFTTPDNFAYKVTDGVGTWTFEDTVDNFNTALKDLKFIPQDDFREDFTGMTSISVKISDGLENGTSARNGSIFIDYGTKTSWWDLLE